MNDTLLKLRLLLNEWYDTEYLPSKNSHVISESVAVNWHDFPLSETVVQPKPGEVVKIDVAPGGDMFINKPDVTIDGKGGKMEIFTSAWAKDVDRFVSSERFVSHHGGVRSKIKNVFLHDFGNFGQWSTAIDSELKGCLLWNIGYKNGSLGHIFYTQNNSGVKKVYDNIFSTTYETNFNVHQYGSTNAAIRGYDYQRNILIRTIWLMTAGNTPVSDTKLKDNCCVKASIKVGLFSPLDGVEIINQTMFDCTIEITNGRKCVIRNCKIYQTGYGGGVCVQLPSIRDNYAGLDCDNNEYIIWGVTGAKDATGLPYSKFGANGNGYQTIEAWRAATGFDLNSTMTVYADSVPPDDIVIYPHEDDKERASIVIANFSKSDAVDINLSSVTGLIAGNSYELINSQNPDESLIFTLAANKIVTVKMTGWTVATPIGIDLKTTLMPVQPNLFPQYGVFYLMPNYT